MLSDDGPFTRLAVSALKSAIKIDEHLKSIHGETLTLKNNDLLVDLPNDIEDLRSELVQVSHDMRQLASGPVVGLTDLLFTVRNYSLLIILYCKAYTGYSVHRPIQCAISIPLSNS